MNIYIIGNTLDEIPRAIKSESEESAIEKAKANVTPEAIKEHTESYNRIIESHRSVLEACLKDSEKELQYLNKELKKTEQEIFEAKNPKVNFFEKLFDLAKPNEEVIAIYESSKMSTIGFINATKARIDNYKKRMLEIGEPCESIDIDDYEWYCVGILDLNKEVQELDLNL